MKVAAAKKILHYHHKRHSLQSLGTSNQSFIIGGESPSRPYAPRRVSHGQLLATEGFSQKMHLVQMLPTAHQSNSQQFIVMVQPPK